MMDRRALLLAVPLLVLAANGSDLAQDPPVAIDTTVCDLVHRPLDFENKHVRVRGTVEQGLEFFGLTHDTCPSEDSRSGSIWLARPGEDDVETYYRGWTLQKFIQAARSGELKQGPQVSWQVPSPVSPLDERQLQRLYKVLKHSKAGSVQALIEGRFDFVGEGLLVKLHNGNFSFQGGFGHLGACSCRIVLEQVELEQ